jgi:hypothetical protein
MGCGHLPLREDYLSSSVSSVQYSEFPKHLVYRELDRRTQKLIYFIFKSFDIVRTWWTLLCVPDEGYCVYLMKVIVCTWWRLLCAPDEGYCERLMKVIECTWWRLLCVLDEGYCVYLMKVIVCTWCRLLCVPDEGYCVYLMKVIVCTWWRLSSSGAHYNLHQVHTITFIRYTQ